MERKSSKHHVETNAAEPVGLPFVVDDTPFCVWDLNLHHVNEAFLRNIDPGYFSYVAKIHEPHLEGDDKHNAFAALRMAYYHGLETFFALLCSVLQAPKCTVAWITKYNNSNLISLVRKIHENTPVYNRLGLPSVSWKQIATTIHGHVDFAGSDDEALERMHEFFGHLWENFASDFLDEANTAEYNSHKHGFRTRPGGFHLTVTPVSQVSGQAATSDSLYFEGSAFGSVYYTVHKLQEKGLNFNLAYNSRNLHPHDLAPRLELLAISIANTVAYARVLNGYDTSSSQKIPTNGVAIEALWTNKVDIGNMSINPIGSIDERSFPTKQEIIATYVSMPQETLK